MTFSQRVRLFARVFALTTRDTGLAARSIPAHFWIVLVAIAVIGDLILYLLLVG